MKKRGTQLEEGERRHSKNHRIEKIKTRKARRGWGATKLCHSCDSECFNVKMKRVQPISEATANQLLAMEDPAMRAGNHALVKHGLSWL